MTKLSSHDIHAGWGAVFTALNGFEAVASYGEARAEYDCLRESAGVVDLGFRSRLCLLGADRKRFLHGQVTNDVNRLKPGEGRYAALVTAKGKMQSDLNIYCLQNELLLDFEPGLAVTVAERLQKYVIADDVEVVDAGPHYGMVAVAGPKAAEICRKSGFEAPESAIEFSIAPYDSPEWGEVYVARRALGGAPGYQFFAPTAGAGGLLTRLAGLARELGGRPCGWEAVERSRIESGIPRFGVDMDETNLAPEAGIEATAISYSKGCYIGQEIIARIRTYGQVAKRLRGLDLGMALDPAPKAGSKLLCQGKESGYLTSAVFSPRLGRWIGLGYVRRDADREGAAMEVASGDAMIPARIVPLPFGELPDSGAAVGTAGK